MSFLKVDNESKCIQQPTLTFCAHWVIFRYHYNLEGLIRFMELFTANQRTGK